MRLASHISKRAAFRNLRLDYELLQLSATPRQRKVGLGFELAYLLVEDSADH
jgi:hypothetical protein